MVICSQSWNCSKIQCCYWEMHQMPEDKLKCLYLAQKYIIPWSHVPSLELHYTGSWVTSGVQLLPVPQLQSLNPAHLIPFSEPWQEWRFHTVRALAEVDGLQGSYTTHNSLVTDHMIAWSLPFITHDIIAWSLTDNMIPLNVIAWSLTIWYHPWQTIAWSVAYWPLIGRLRR